MTLSRGEALAQMFPLFTVALLAVNQVEHSNNVIFTQTKGMFFVSVMLFHYDEQ